MATRNEIVICARAYLDCPYRHQGRIKAGLDCIGLAIAVCRDLGLGDFDFQAYSREPDGVTLLGEIEKVCHRLDSWDEYQPGDLLTFRIRRLPQHCGIATEMRPLSGAQCVSAVGMGGLGLIHAYQSIGKVAEHSLTDWWVERIVAAYRLPGVEG